MWRKHSSVEKESTYFQLAESSFFFASSGPAGVARETQKNKNKNK